MPFQLGTPQVTMRSWFCIPVAGNVDVGVYRLSPVYAALHVTCPFGHLLSTRNAVTTEVHEKLGDSNRNREVEDVH